MTVDASTSTSKTTTHSEDSSMAAASLNTNGLHSHVVEDDRRTSVSPSTSAYASAPTSPSGSASVIGGLVNGTGTHKDAHTDLHHPNDAHRVLLLLDIQLGMLSPPPIGVPASQSVRSNLDHILTHARIAKPSPLIVHVRNSGDVGDPDEPLAPGWHLIFPPQPGEIVIDKRKNNAFAGTTLGEVVPPTAEIVVAGFQTDYSIRATCSAALGRGNEVLLIRGAHATHDRIEVLHGGGITPAGRIEGEIEAELEEAGVHLLEMKDLPGIFTDR